MGTSSTNAPAAAAHVQDLDEQAFLALVCELAAWCGWRVYHTHDSRRSTPGFPDLCLVRSPAVIFAELKTDRGRLTRDQHAWLEALGACPGVEVYCWRPAQWPDVAARLTRCS